MHRFRLPALLVLILALVALPGLTPAASAKRHKLPKGFFGTVLDPTLTAPAVPDATLDAQFKKMRSSGVESVRVTFNWGTANPTKGTYDWREIDRVVAASAKSGVALLPIVQYTPRWASTQPTGRDNIPYQNWPPQKTSQFAGFMRKLVKRYGPKGTYFKTHKGGAKAARIRNWQIWNEPMQPFYWGDQPKWWRTYAPMLKAAHTAVHKLDKRAIVTTAALSGSNAGPAWEDLAHIYKVVGRKAFDAVTINQYTNAEGAQYIGKPALKPGQSVDNLFQVGNFTRRVMRRYHDTTKKPIYFTEFGWPAAFNKLPKANYKGFETTFAGAAKRLAVFASRLANNARFDDAFKQGRKLRTKSLGIRRAYYYTWGSGFEGAPRQSPFDYSGLNKVTGTTFSPTPVLSAYRKLAKRY